MVIDSFNLLLTPYSLSVSRLYLRISVLSVLSYINKNSPEHKFMHSRGWCLAKRGSQSSSFLCPPSLAQAV